MFAVGASISTIGLVLLGVILAAALPSVGARGSPDASWCFTPDHAWFADVPSRWRTDGSPRPLTAPRSRPPEPQSAGSTQLPAGKVPQTTEVWPATVVSTRKVSLLASRLPVLWLYWAAKICCSAGTVRPGLRVQR